MTRSQLHSLEAIAAFLSPYMYGGALRGVEPVPLIERWRSYFGGGSGDIAKLRPDSFPAFCSASIVRAFLKVAEAEVIRPVSDWATQLEPWDRVVEAAAHPLGRDVGSTSASRSSRLVFDRRQLHARMLLSP